MCIKHIRPQALEHLIGLDFLPYKQNSLWDLPTSILDKFFESLASILIESPPPYQTLPYLMATYKQLNGKYRWLTNAYCIDFSNTVLLLTISSKMILEEFKR